MACINIIRLEAVSRWRRNRLGPIAQAVRSHGSWRSWFPKTLTQCTQMWINPNTAEMSFDCPVPLLLTPLFLSLRLLEVGLITEAAHLFWTSQPGPRPPFHLTSALASLQLHAKTRRLPAPYGRLPESYSCSESSDSSEQSWGWSVINAHFDYISDLLNNM